MQLLPSKIRACFLLLGCVWALNAHAALFEDDEARKAIIDLRQKVDGAQQRNADELSKAREENAQLRRSMLDLSNQIEALRAEVARMRGQEEQLARDVSELQRHQKDLSQGVEDRLKKIEPGKVSIDGKEFVADPNETRDFEAALGHMRKSDFAQAQNAFMEFNRRYPSSGYKPSSLFWLGNAQYALRNYREAVTMFRTLISQSPDHGRAPEAMLSIASCQRELKEPKLERKTLEDLIKAYPQSEAAAAAKERVARLK